MSDVIELKAKTIPCRFKVHPDSPWIRRPIDDKIDAYLAALNRAWMMAADKMMADDGCDSPLIVAHNSRPA